MKDKETIRQIGKIYNYYGALSVKEESGHYFWSIEDYNGDYWEEIPKSLYDSLMKYQDDCDEKPSPPSSK